MDIWELSQSQVKALMDDCEMVLTREWRTLKVNVDDGGVKWKAGQGMWSPSHGVLIDGNGAPVRRPVLPGPEAAVTKAVPQVVFASDLRLGDGIVNVGTVTRMEQMSATSIFWAVEVERTEWSMVTYTPRTERRELLHHAADELAVIRPER